jgi:hypothetical protein
MDSDPEDDVMPGAEDHANSPGQGLSDDKAARKRKRLEGEEDEEGDEGEEDEEDDEEVGGESARRKAGTLHPGEAQR